MQKFRGKKRESGSNAILLNCFGTTNIFVVDLYMQYFKIKKKPENINVNMKVSYCKQITHQHLCHKNIMARSMVHLVKMFNLV